MTGKTIRAFFDTRVEEWDQLRYDDETYIGRARAAVRFISSGGSHRRILDLGCGTGRQSVELLKQGHHVVCADISQAMARATRDRILRECPEDIPRVVVADATMLPFRAGCFDVIMALGLLGFVQDRDNLLVGFRNVITSRGELACDTGIPEELVLFQFISRTLEKPLLWAQYAWYTLRSRARPKQTAGWYAQNFIKHSPAEFEALLQRNGFRPINRAGAGFGELRVMGLPLLPWRIHSAMTRILNHLSARTRTRFLAQHALTYVVRSIREPAAQLDSDRYRDRQSHIVTAFHH